MSMKFYKIVLRDGAGDRTVRVPSPTGAQAADAASKVMREGESIVSIEEAPDDGQQHEIDTLPPLNQADELASVTPGAASTDRGD